MERVDTRTGEITEAEPAPLSEPQSLADVNTRIAKFIDALGHNSRARTVVRRELEPLKLRYVAVYDSALLTSDRTEARLREAEARQAVDAEGLTVQVSRLELDLKVLTDLGHDIRSGLSSMQTVAKNLQAEMSALGFHPG